MASTAPSGDQISKQVDHHKSTDTNLSDLAHSLTSAHDHRPGAWQQDLAKTNAAMHKNGLLPGLDIVGVNGHDLVTRDKSGNTHVVDSSNTTHQHLETQKKSTEPIGGRKADIAADGSGTVTAGHADKSPWVLSQAMLKSQGIENPTPNQMANYQKELEKLNNKKVAEFKPGEQIKIPPITKDGDHTEFKPDGTLLPAPDKRTTPVEGAGKVLPAPIAGDGSTTPVESKVLPAPIAGDGSTTPIESKVLPAPVDKTNPQDLPDPAAVDKSYDQATAAAAKFAGIDTPWYSRTTPASLSKADIEKGLASNPTADEKAGLDFLKKNFDRLANTDSEMGLWKTGVIFHSDLNKGRTADKAQAQQQLADRIGADP